MPVADARVLAKTTTTGDALEAGRVANQNAMQAYQDMLASQAAQAEANKGELAGKGMFGKLQSAIAGSPQLQSGLMAAGLSLLTGGSTADALAAGTGAVANWNQQAQAETDAKKAEALGTTKQLAQLENNASEVDYRSRLPEGQIIAGINAGVANRQQTMDFLRLRAEMAQNALGSVPEDAPLSFDQGYALADFQLGQGQTLFDLKIPGVKSRRPTEIQTPTRKQRALIDNFARIAESPDWWDMTPAEQLAVAKDYQQQYGLGKTVATNDLVKLANKARPSPVRPRKGETQEAPAAKPASEKPAAKGAPAKKEEKAAKPYAPKSASAEKIRAGVTSLIESLANGPAPRTMPIIGFDENGMPIYGVSPTAPRFPGM